MIVDDAAHANPTMPPPLPVADLARIHHQAMDHARRIVELLRAELCGGASTAATTAAASSSSSATTASGKFLPSSATIEQALDAVAERVDLSARNSAAQLAAALAPSPPAKRGAATKAKSASAAATATASAAAAAPTSASPIASLLELQADLARSLPRTVALSSINTVRQWTAALYQREPALLELSAESNSKGLEAMLGRSAVATERHRDEEYQAMVVAELSGKAWPAMSLKKNVAVGSAAASAVVAAPATTAKHGGDMTTQPKDKDDNTPPTDDQASATSAQEDTADDARSSRRPMRQAAIKAMQTTEEMSTTASTLPDAMHRIDVAEVERNKTPGQGLMAPRYALIMKAGDRHVFSSLRATKAVGPVPLRRC